MVLEVLRKNCFELWSKFRISETHLFRFHVICPGNFSNTLPVELRCPLAPDSSTKTGPDGGGGRAKQEGRSLGMSSLRPGKLQGAAMDPRHGLVVLVSQVRSEVIEQLSLCLHVFMDALRFFS